MHKNGKSTVSGAFSVLYSVLAVVDFVIEALLFKKFFMFSGFDYFAVVDNKDKVRINDCGKPVGNYKAGFVFH